MSRICKSRQRVLRYQNSSPKPQNPKTPKYVMDPMEKIGDLSEPFFCPVKNSSVDEVCDCSICTS